MTAMNLKWMKLAGLAAVAASVGCGVDGPSNVGSDNDQVAGPPTPPLSCSYPATGAGTDVGNTVPVLEWQAALFPDNDKLTALQTGEFLDCDGYKGANALVFLTHTPG